MSKSIRRGSLVALCLASVVFGFWKVEANRDAASRSVAETVRADPAANHMGTALTQPEGEAERTTNLAPKPVAVKESTNSKAPLYVRALCVNESGEPIEGVALTVVSLADCSIAYSDSTGLAHLEFERDLERVGMPFPVLKSAGAPIAAQLSKTGRTTRILYGPGLEALEQHDFGRVELHPAGIVVGRVVGPSGLPIVGAQVLPAPPLLELPDEATRTLQVSGLFMLSLKLGGAGTTTDFDGRFRIEGMSTEPTCLWSQQSGTYAAWSEPIRLEAGETLDIGSLTLETLASDDRIVGQVLNIDGSPSAGATITSESVTSGASGPQTLAEADGNGRFLVPALAGVTHGLNAQHATEVSLRVRLDDVLGGNLEVVLQFEEDEPVTPTTGQVEGRVLLDGEPAPFATIEPFFYRDSSVVPIEGLAHRADSEGRFALDLPFGAMRLQARSSDGAFVGMSAEITVAAPQEAEELVIELVAAAAIDGLVLAPGVELSGVEFRATGPNGLTHKTSTRKDGSFEFERLQPGAWTVKRISTSLFTRGDNTPAGVEPRELELAEGDTARLEFDLRNSAQLEGRIAIGDQNLVAWVWSVAETQGEFDAEGRFRIPAIAQLGETYLGFGGRLAHSIVNVTSQLRLQAGLNSWSFEVETGRVELLGLPLESQFPRDDSFEPVCTLHYEHPNGTVWEAMPLTAKSGKRMIKHVPVGRVLVVRGGIGARAELLERPGVPVGQVLAELEVRAGATASFKWPE